MVAKSSKTKGRLKKASKRPRRSTKSQRALHDTKAPSKLPNESKPSLTLQVPIHLQRPIDSATRPVFSIEIGSISGDTTIGDLIVAFPRTRDVLMKHGLRFDVEEAGFLYMTLNVFSAIHGLATNNLVQELHTASKEPPPQQSVQQLRPIPAAPSA